MSVNLSPILNGFQSFLNTGLPNNGGLIYTYAAGTTTPTATYTSVTGSTPNANPIVLDSYGRVPNEIWLTSGVAYKLAVTDSSSVQLGVYDNIFGVNDINATSVGSSVVSKTGLIGSALMPAGTTGQRDSVPGIGYTRFNTTTNQVEAYTGTGWYSAAPIASPTFTGTVTAGGFAGPLTGSATSLSAASTLPNGTLATTQARTDNSTNIATTAMVQSASPGGGQTPTSFVGSRVIGTIYTNSTGKPFMLNVAANTATNAQLLIAGVVVAYYNSGGIWNGGGMVPVGATYQLTSGASTITTWTETV